MHRKISQFGAAALAIAVTGTPVWADETLDVGEVMVTASKVPLPASKVGSAVTIITEQQIKASGFTDVHQLLRRVPGMAVSRLGTRGTQTQVRLRGSEANHVLVMIDGIEATDPVLGTFEFAHLSVDHIERIEVLRGAQSALFGADALAGVINIVTKKGKGDPSGSVIAEYGSFDSGQISGQFSGSHEGGHFSLSGVHADTKGTNVAETALIGERDGYERTQLHLRAGAQVTENLKLDFIARANSTDAQFDGTNFAIGATQDDDRNTATSRIYLRAEGALLLADGQVALKASAAHTGSDSETYTNGAVTSRNDGGKADYLVQGTCFFQTDVFGFADHSLTVAAEHERVWGNNGNVNNSTREYAFIGEYNVTLIDDLHLSGALRYDNFDPFDSATTWRATAAYQVHPWGTRFHSAGGTGIAAPNFTELYGNFAPFFVGNPNVKPEKSKSFDFGVEQQLLDGKALIDVTYYWAQLEDEIVTQGNTVANAGADSRRWGIEVQGRYSPLPNLNINGSYTYARSEIGGVTEIRRPRHVASLSADGRLMGGKLGLGLGIDFNGRQPDTIFTFPNQAVTLGSFTLVTATADYRIDAATRIFLRVENALDEDYWEVYSYNTPGIGAFIGLERELR